MMRIKNLPLSSLLILLVLSLLCSTSDAQNKSDKDDFARPGPIAFYKCRKAANPSLFQGNRKKRKYFEGWYFKMVAHDASAIMSIIPGISLSADGKDQHAFVQVINGVTAQTFYFPFPIEDFSFSKKTFAVRIADNYFSEDSLIINLKDSVSAFSGRVIMNNLVPYPSKKILDPGIMGWYRFVPFMQCYHGVVSLSHGLNGVLTSGNESYNFDGGRGYIEKDWGSGMPSAWIWMQSNNFSNPGLSFMLSVAHIPWLGNSFTGFLGFLYDGQKVYNFATYTSSRLSLEVTDSNTLHIIIQNKKNTLVISARSNNTGLLKAPVQGSMDRRIAESIDAEIVVSMFDKKGGLIFTDSTVTAGLEMVGDYLSLQGLHK